MLSFANLFATECKEKNMTGNVARQYMSLVALLNSGKKVNVNKLESQITFPISKINGKGFIVLFYLINYFVIFTKFF